MQYKCLFSPTFNLPRDLNINFEGIFNPFALTHSFLTKTPFLYPLKTSEDLTVFCCFQGLEKGCIGNEWVNLKLLSHKFESFFH